MTEVQEYLTPSEVAKKLRVSLDTVYRLLKGGKLKGVRRGEGGFWLIEPAAVDEFLVRPRGPARTVPPMPSNEEAIKALGELRARGYKV